MIAYYITYRNCGKPERTPVLGDSQEHANKNVTLLKIQGATSIRIHLKEVGNVHKKV